MPFLTNWLTVFFVGLVAVISPGPDFALTLRNSLTYSRRAGIYTAIGVAAGNLVHVTYSLIGIGAVISRSVLLFNALKWLGAAYLIYIGLKSLGTNRSLDNAPGPTGTKNLSPWAALQIGFWGNLLNPKASLFFLALFTQIIHPRTPVFLQALYGITIAVLALVWFALVAVVISQPAVKNLFLSISGWAERVMGAVLIGLGLRLVFAKGN